MCAEDSKIKVELAFQHTDTYTDNIISYVNNIPTTEGGTHEVGFKGGFTKFMNDYARKNNLLKEKEANLIGEDFREGLTAVLSIKMTNIQFEGQTKTKLGNPEAKVVVEKIVAAELTKFFTGTQNNKTAEIIINKAKGAAKVREAARKAKEITRVKNSLDNYNLVGKLSNCTGRKPEQSELFIVEGDSAGGSAKQGRDRRFQAILPLKGKPLNAEKKRLDQVLANEEILLLWFNCIVIFWCTDGVPSNMANSISCTPNTLHSRLCSSPFRRQFKVSAFITFRTGSSQCRQGSSLRTILPFMPLG